MNSRGVSQTGVNLRLHSHQLNSLRLLGLYPLSGNVNVILKIAYNVCSALIMFTSAIIVLCRFAYLMRGTLLDGLSSGTSLTIGYTVGFSESLIYLCTRKKNIQIQNAVEICWKTICLRENDQTIHRIMRETKKA